MSNAKQDMQVSAGNFERLVWPRISHWFGDDLVLYKTEDHPDTLRTEFDRVSGVDFWAIERGAGMISVASRVQTYDKTTFTIRYSRGTGNETEYQKRMRQLRSDYELPTYTVQAYIDPTLEVLRNVAACRTDALYEYISQGEPGDDWPLISSNEHEMFFPVSWSELDCETDLLVHDRNRAGLEAPKPDDPTDITAWGAAHE